MLEGNYKIIELCNGEKGYQPCLVLFDINTNKKIVITISNDQKFNIMEEN